MNNFLSQVQPFLPYLMVIGGWLISVEFRLKQFKIEIDRALSQSDKIIMKLDDITDRMARIETKLEK